MRTACESFIALVFLLVICPVLLIVALGIIIDHPGNPFYLAKRAGLFGRPFMMFKFRTMIPNAVHFGPPITGHNDTRITRIGRFLRRTKLDELPQFINVVKGEMSLVGPRPEAPEIVALYTSEQLRVMTVKPGITGTSQIQGDESQLIPEGVAADEYYIANLLDNKVRRDIAYICSRSTTSDVKILFATVVFVFQSALGSKAPGLPT